MEIVKQLLRTIKCVINTSTCQASLRFKRWARWVQHWSASGNHGYLEVPSTQLKASKSSSSDLTAVSNASTRQIKLTANNPSNRRDPLGLSSEPHLCWGNSSYTIQADDSWPPCYVQRVQPTICCKFWYQSGSEGGDEGAGGLCGKGQRRARTPIICAVEIDPLEEQWERWKAWLPLSWYQ